MLNFEKIILAFYKAFNIEGLVDYDKKKRLKTKIENLKKTKNHKDNLDEIISMISDSNLRKILDLTSKEIDEYLHLIIRFLHEAPLCLRLYKNIFTWFLSFIFCMKYFEKNYKYFEEFHIYDDFFKLFIPYKKNRKIYSSNIDYIFQVFEENFGAKIEETYGQKIFDLVDYGTMKKWRKIDSPQVISNKSILELKNILMGYNDVLSDNDINVFIALLFFGRTSLYSYKNLSKIPLITKVSYYVYVFMRSKVSEDFEEYTIANSKELDKDMKFFTEIIKRTPSEKKITEKIAKTVLYREQSLYDYLVDDDKRKELLLELFNYSELYKKLNNILIKIQKMSNEQLKEWFDNNPVKSRSSLIETQMYSVYYNYINSKVKDQRFKKKFLNNIGNKIRLFDIDLNDFKQEILKIDNFVVELLDSLLLKDYKLFMTEEEVINWFRTCDDFLNANAILNE